MVEERGRPQLPTNRLACKECTDRSGASSARLSTQWSLLCEGSEKNEAALVPSWLEHLNDHISCCMT